MNTKWGSTSRNRNWTVDCTRKTEFDPRYRSGYTASAGATTSPATQELTGLDSSPKLARQLNPAEVGIDGRWRPATAKNELRVFSAGPGDGHQNYGWCGRGRRNVRPNGRFGKGAGEDPGNGARASAGNANRHGSQHPRVEASQWSSAAARQDSRPGNESRRLNRHSNRKPLNSPRCRPDGERRSGFGDTWSWLSSILLAILHGTAFSRRHCVKTDI